MMANETLRDFAAFVISTSEIGINALEFKQEMSAEALNALLFEPARRDFSWRANRDFLASFWLTRENSQTFKVLGQIELVLTNACVRCLNDTEHLINIDFSMRMIEKDPSELPKEGGKDDWFFDSESLAFDEESEYTVSYFSNRQIDLAQVLREQIFLALPDYPQCGVGFALTKTRCETLIPLANVDEDESKKQNPFVRLLAKRKLD